MWTSSWFRMGFQIAESECNQFLEQKLCGVRGNALDNECHLVDQPLFPPTISCPPLIDS